MKKLLTKLRTHAVGEILREYKWLCRYSLHYKGEVLWYVFTGILGTAVSLIGSVLSKNIIDAVTGFNSRGIVAALVFFVLMQLAQIVINAVASRISAKISIRVNQQITADVYDKLLKTDWEALSSYHSGDLLTRIVGDVSTVSSSVLGWIPDLCTRLLQFLGALGLILYYDPTLALLALLSAPTTLLMSRYVVNKMRQHTKKMRELNSKMVIFNEETFQNIQLIKAFDRANSYSQKHRDLQEEYKNASLAYNRFSIRKNTILSLVGTVVTLICFSWSVYRLWTGHITYGTMTLFLQLSASLAAAFSALAGMIPSAISAATAAGRILTVTELPQEQCEETPQAQHFLHNNCGLRVEAKDLSYYYEEGLDVLSQVDFQAEPGQIVAFIGPSGKGKTTLLRLLLGIIQPKKGTLELCNDEGNSLSIGPATRKLFSYVPQGNTLFTGTVRENLHLINPAATDQELYQVLSVACADDFIRALPLGLDTPIREQGGGFSEGQLQRICIARALLSAAPILLMDEATSALDIETEQRVLANIMATQKNRTCIITTHRPSVLDISDKVYRVSENTVELVSPAYQK